MLSAQNNFCIKRIGIISRISIQKVRGAIIIKNLIKIWKSLRIREPTFSLADTYSLLRFIDRIKLIKAGRSTLTQFEVTILLIVACKLDF